MNNIRDIRAEAVRLADDSHRAVILGVCGSMIMKLKRHPYPCQCSYCRMLETYILVKKHKSRFFRRYEFVREWYSAEQSMQIRKDYEDLRNEVKKLRAQKEDLKREAAIEMMR